MVRKTFLLNDDDFDVVKEVAKANNRSVSYMLREIARQWVKNLPNSNHYSRLGLHKELD